MEEEQPKKEEEGFFTKVWNKTVFSDMVTDAKEEKAMKREIQREAKLEAREEIKEIMKQHYIEKEKAKMTGKGKGAGFLGKLGAEFKEMGDNVGKKDIGAMMGFGGGANGNNQGGSGISNEKIGNMMGMGNQQTPEAKPKDIGQSPISDEKIKRMLGR